MTILESIGKTEIYSAGFSDALTFYQVNDQLNFNASLLLIATIGDQIAKISHTTIIKHPNIPWQKIKGTRNRIVHDYAGIDYDITFKIVKEELPALKGAVEELVKAELAEGIFSAEDLGIARESTWYQHVDFQAIV